MENGPVRKRALEVRTGDAESLWWIVDQVPDLCDELDLARSKVDATAKAQARLEARLGSQSASIAELKKLVAKLTKERDRLATRAEAPRAPAGRLCERDARWFVRAGWEDGLEMGYELGIAGRPKHSNLTPPPPEGLLKRHEA